MVGWRAGEGYVLNNIIIHWRRKLEMQRLRSLDQGIRLRELARCYVAACWACDEICRCGMFVLFLQSIEAHFQLGLGREREPTY